MSSPAALQPSEPGNVLVTYDGADLSSALDVAASASASAPEPAAAAASGPTKVCHKCGTARTLEHYSHAQLKRQGKRKCRRCVALEAPPAKLQDGVLPGISDGGCVLVMRNPGAAPEDAKVQQYQDQQKDQYWIVSRPGDPCPTLAEDGSLSFDGVPAAKGRKQIGFTRMSVGSDAGCGRPKCPKWLPQMKIDAMPEPEKITEPLIECESCKHIWWCSKECQQAHAATHDPWCFGTKKGKEKK